MKCIWKNRTATLLTFVAFSDQIYIDTTIVGPRTAGTNVLRLLKNLLFMPVKTKNSISEFSQFFGLFWRLSTEQLLVNETPPKYPKP